MLGKFHPGAVTHAVDRVLEQVEQCLDRLAVHADFFGKLASLVGHAKDAAVGLIAVWVTNVVLHVADDDVLPVGDIERSVAADLEVGRSEVAVAGDEQILGLSAPDVALVIIFHRVLLDAKEANGVADEKVTVVFLWEMIAGKDATGTDRADGFLEQLLHLKVALAVWTNLIGTTAGAVSGVVITPIIEADAVRVRAVVGVTLEAEGSRVKAVHRRGGVALRPLPRGLDVTHVEHAALVVNVPVRPVHEVVGRVVSVGGVEAVEQALLHISHVIPVGVLEIDQVRAARHNHATVPKLEPGWVVHSGKGDHFVGLAVPVFVRENHQRILHFLVRRVADRLPLRVGRPDSRPDTALGVDAHLHRVDHAFEHFLRGEDVGLHVWRELKLG